MPNEVIVVKVYWEHIPLSCNINFPTTPIKMWWVFLFENIWKFQIFVLSLLKIKYMGLIRINGKSFTGNSVSISGNKIIIDGISVDSPDSKEIKISIEGDIQELVVDNCDSIGVKGNVGAINTKNGNVVVDGTVLGSVESKNGNINCGNVSGSVETKNGNIRHR